MGMNFPNSPVPGQVYTPVGGYSYVFLDGVWRIVQDAQSILTADTRNRIVNGAMQISQENGVTAGTANQYYGADQWFTWFVGTPTLTTQRIGSFTPHGSVRRYRVTVTAADAALAAGDQFYIQTMIEGSMVADNQWGYSAAKQMILRFGFRGPAGTYSISLRNNAGDRSYVANFTISAGQADANTEQVFVIPGDTTGAWFLDTTVGIKLAVVLATGTTTQGVAGWQAGAMLGTASNTNGMATAGAVYELFDVGLYLDPLATGVPPRWQMPDEAEELRACQRYYYETLDPDVGSFYVNGASGTLHGQSYFHPVAMRTAPAVTTPTARTYSNCTFGDQIATAAYYYLRLTSSAAGLYRGYNGRNVFSARM